MAAIATSLRIINNENTMTKMVGEDTVTLYDISINYITKNGIAICEKTVKVKTAITDKTPIRSVINSKLKVNNTHASSVENRIEHALNMIDMMYSNETLNTSNFIHTMNDISDLGRAILNNLAMNECANIYNRYGPLIYNAICNIPDSLIFNNPERVLTHWERKDIELLKPIWNKISSSHPELNEPFPNVVNAYIASNMPPQ